MEFTVYKEKELHAEGGIVFCEVQIALPMLPGEERAAKEVNRFYKPLREEALRLAREVLLPHSKACYEGSENPRRRFTHRPYRLFLAVTVKDEGESLRVERTLSLLFRGRTLLAEVAHERILPSGRVIPIKKRKEA